MEENQVYEFSDFQNEDLGRLFERMRLLALLLVVSGALVVVGGCTMAVQLIFSELPRMWGLFSLVFAAGGGLMVTLGLLLLKSARSVRSIVDTRGSDITHLMVALQGLTRFFGIAVGMSLVMIFALLGMMAMVLQHMRPAPLMP